MRVLPVKNHASDPLQLDGCKLSVLLAVLQFGVLQIWHLWKHLLTIEPCEYNLDLSVVMSFHLVPHMPRLVAIVAKFLC